MRKTCQFDAGGPGSAVWRFCNQPGYAVVTVRDDALERTICREHLVAYRKVYKNHPRPFINSIVFVDHEIRVVTDHDRGDEA